MIYRAAIGARITDEQAQRFGDRIETLVEGNNGSITPEAVLTDAKKKRSPLNEYFEWDDSAAADGYRLEQARELLRYIHVIVTKDDASEMEIRAFHNVVVTSLDPDTRPERTYASLARVLSDDDLRGQVLARAMHEFEQWRKRYQELKELAPIFKGYEAVKQSVG